MPRERTSPALLVTLLGVSTLTILASATITPALPGIRQYFAGTQNVDLLVRLVLTLPGLVIVLTAPVLGFLSTRIGRVRVLAGGLVLYAAGGGSGLVLDSLPALLGGRALLGVGVAAIMTTATALIADHHPPSEHGRVLGFQGAALGFGGVIAVFLGGTLAELSWRGPFAVYLLALPALVLVLFFVMDTPEPKSGTEGTRPARATWTPQLFGLYALVALSIVVFYVLPTQGPFWLVEVGAMSPVVIGAAFAGVNLVMTVIGLNFGRLRARWDFRALAVALFAAYAIGLVVVGTAGNLVTAVIGMLIAGVGIGLSNPTFNGWVVSSVDPSARTRALGLVTSLLYLGQFSSPLIAQPIVVGAGLSAAFLAASALGAIVAVTLTVIHVTGRSRRKSWPTTTASA
ncbi:MFS transporter [Lentzea sp. NPDC059081]|uniref:MFS transporter n=1 Tax=Lentzea sp. NPDC059081 TaxID=3346719 RepID=UPI0036833685